MDDEDEDSFREALGPKVKIIDPASFRAGQLDLTALKRS